MSATQERIEFGGIRIETNPYMPTNELWLVQRGDRREVHVHEGPKAGEDVEVWLQKPRIVRLVNLGELLAMPKPKEEI